MCRAAGSPVSLPNWVHYIFTVRSKNLVFPPSQFLPGGTDQDRFMDGLFCARQGNLRVIKCVRASRSGGIAV
jgi:hypothetical protein